MARKRDRQGQREPRNPRQFANTVSRLREKQQTALERGNIKRAERLGNRIEKRISRRPQSAFPLAQQFAEDELQRNIQVNRPNQQTIGGSREYVTNPDGSVSVVDALSPEQQALYNQQIQGVGAANQAFLAGLQGGIPFGQAYDFSGAPAAPSTQDLGAERRRIEDAIYGREAEFINREAERRRAELEQTLYDRGTPPGTPAGNDAIKRFEEGLSQELSQARTKAIAEGGAEFERSFNIGTRGRQDAISEEILGRTQPLSELSLLAGFGGGPTVLPNFFDFQPIQYQQPSYLDFVTTGVETQLARKQLAQQNRGPTVIAGGGVPAPAFSFNTGYPAAPVVPGVPAPDPVLSGFATGAAAGAVR